MLQRVAAQQTDPDTLDDLAITAAEIVSDNRGIKGTDLLSELKDQSDDVSSVMALTVVRYARDTGLIERRGGVIT